MTFTNYLEEKLLDHVFGNQAYSAPTDPTGDPTLKIYTTDQTLVATITAGIQHPAVGVYYHDRTIDTTGEMIYEFSGLMEGSTTLVRGAYKVIFGRFGDRIL